MKTKLRDFFTFTDRERNGSFVLLSLIALMIIIIFVQQKFISPPPQDFSQFDSFLSALEKKHSADSLKNDSSESKKDFPDIAEEAYRHNDLDQKQLFVFDPNGLPEKDWVRLGLSPAQAKVIKKYEAKVGKFESKEDVKKLFVISAERYAELEPFIALPETAPKKSANDLQQFSKTKQKQIVELNTADSTDLIALDGIGPSFARRIIQYRERLGGFYSVNQLTEVFGIDQEHFDPIKNSLTADSSFIRKINVNTAQVSDLKKHPYFSPALANALVNYRKQHGPFRSVADIRGCNLVNGDLYRKIAPYLTI